MIFTGVDNKSNSAMQFRGSLLVRLGQQSETQIKDANFKDGYFGEQIRCDVGTEDVDRHPYNVKFSLKLPGDVLNGAVTTISLQDRAATP
jgi:hypothetical protein